MEFNNVNELLYRNKYRLGSTEWKLITQTDVNNFASLTGDFQWIHIDESRSRIESPFGSTIAHGSYILALIPVFVGELFQVGGISHIVNSGMEKVRLREAVPVNAHVRGVVGLESIEEFSSGLLGRFSVSVEVEGQRRPACTAEQRMVIYV